MACAAAQNATSYRIERRKVGGAWEVVATVDGTTYDDTTITHPTKGSYSYRIASLDGNSSVAYTLDFVPTGTPSPRGLVIIFK